MDRDRQVVLIGEASHGTHDFYRERALITSQEYGVPAMNDAQAFWILGDRYVFLHSGKSISLLEIESTIQHGPPPHVHHNEDETLYVIDGEIKV
jgi:mannose-6-phosphate isomerase-like protein (cupin superfamily)